MKFWSYKGVFDCKNYKESILIAKHTKLYKLLLAFEKFAIQCRQVLGFQWKKKIFEGRMRPAATLFDMPAII